MALTKEKKEQLVAEYTEMLQNSRALIVTGYRGLNTSEITKLRRTVSESDARFMIIKNRLFRLAMQNVGLDIPEDFLDGPVAAGFCYGEVPPVAKALTEFADDTEILVVRGGLLDEKFLSDAEINALASLPPLEVVRAQLLGLFSAPASSIAGVMASSVGQVVSVIAAYSESGEEPPSGNGSTPSVEAEAEAEEESAASAEADEPEEAEPESKPAKAEVEAEEENTASAEADEPEEAEPESEPAEAEEAGEVEAEDEATDEGESE